MTYNKKLGAMMYQISKRKLTKKGLDPVEQLFEAIKWICDEKAWQRLEDEAKRELRKKEKRP